MAKWKKESMDDNRGATMFGNLSSQNTQAANASALFLIQLLRYLHQWSISFGLSPDKSPSPFYKAYKKLKDDGVKFPARSSRSP
eukprot:CAMPEP_0201285952 /NCGR_PEP_ID=MMETSP1317-20130820/114064_1 /ASSEMBLY_ACC=CAM_ASM_000770 /TAXON_ID=187299 /ORGANISM="Undescribed Undescribed, Strain Undescribed" /LENGTH=83 /DNA_ID=CAMNT_0047612219 /DNA_START=78 /DNA_END=329 /DNA_ORIENTATION=-